MCLFLMNKTPKMAEENILVFKIVNIFNNKIYSYFKNMPYCKGQSYTSEIEIICSDLHEYVIEAALHSYSLNINQELYISEDGKYMNIGQGINGESYIDHSSYVGLFIIPKGSIYYENDFCYASNNLICLDQFFTFEEWHNKCGFIIKHRSKTFTSNAYINNLKYRKYLNALT